MANLPFLPDKKQEAILVERNTHPGLAQCARELLHGIETKDEDRIVMASKTFLTLKNLCRMARRMNNATYPWEKP